METSRQWQKETQLIIGYFLPYKALIKYHQKEHNPTTRMDSAKQHYPKETILGLDFFNGSLEEGISLALQGGLCCFPSGPGLADLDRKPAYRNALHAADLLFVDSGYLALLWKSNTGRSLNRISGLRFLSTLLEMKEFQNDHRSFWVMPNEREAIANRHYLNTRGISLYESDVYIAPHYNPNRIEDPRLLEKICKQNPKTVVINLGGNIQEPLGAWLASRLPRETTLLCTGAAIAFLSGNQSKIPPWVDYLFLGWLTRILGNPRQYFSRYWKARRLKQLVKTWATE